jgi:prepilin-type N-terminal cleavage/methylation domain-containing protein/prepilin-type processing-associated H-X9-DG protein
MIIQFRSRSSGFSLIELLVVISIIVLLISILLPALGKARASSQMVQCKSNLRQISIAWQTYFADSKDFCPGAHYDYNYGVTNEYTRWYSIPAYYMGLISAPGNVAWYTKFPVQFGAYGVFRCPSDSTIGNDGYTHPNYGFNGILHYPSETYSPVLASVRSGLDGLKIASVKRPSTMMMLGDSANNSYGAFGGPGYSYRISRWFDGGHPYDGPAYSNRHLGQTINYQFVDGHGDSRTSDWVVEELNKYSATVGGRSMFFQNDGDL